MANDARTVQVRHPLAHDLVDERFNVAGIGTGFEGTVGWRVVRQNGQVIAEGGVQAGGMAVLGDFAFTVNLAGRRLPSGESSITLQVFGDNPGLPDEGPDPGFDVNTIPLIAGFRLVDGYFGFAYYRVVAGDTLSKIAREHPFGTTSVDAIFRANRDQLHDPNLIHPGQLLRVPLGG